jgi:hypothetical protein
VLLVNGLPLVLIEAKTPVKKCISWVDGAVQVHGDYEKFVPELFIIITTIFKFGEATGSLNNRSNIIASDLLDTNNFPWVNRLPEKRAYRSACCATRALSCAGTAGLTRWWSNPAALTRTAFSGPP